MRMTDAGGWLVERADADGDEARVLMDALSDALAAITGDPGRSSFDPADLRGPRACFALARDVGGRAVGCGALRPLREDVAEIKRMFARPDAAGAGSAVLRFLEDEARRLGYAALWLETRVANARAVAFYGRHGYARIPNYGRYVGRPEAACFAKTLAAGVGA
jgi:GNAT superfamily N-acetyltransferase